jgi:hypothetical protein
MCTAGVSPVGVRIGSPVAGRAGRRETDGPEAPRRPHPRDECELSGRNASEREVAPKVRSPGGRARNREGEGRRARRKPIDAAGRSGGVVSDGTAARAQPATGEALLVPARKGGSGVGRITGTTGKSADDERVADGPVGSNLSYHTGVICRLDARSSFWASRRLHSGSLAAQLSKSVRWSSSP